jgi:hypothetical protein
MSITSCGYLVKAVQIVPARWQHLISASQKENEQTFLFAHVKLTSCGNLKPAIFFTA